MANIWLQKDKPPQYPGEKNMDLGVGMMIRRFNEIESLLVDIIILSAKLDGNRSKKIIEEWSHSENHRFYDVVQKYKDLKIMDKARCKSLDNIRQERNYIAHQYNGGQNQFGRLWSLNKEI